MRPIFFAPPTRLIPILLLLAALAAGRAAAQDDRPGATQTVPVITLSLNVGSTDKESKRVIYAPPPGWHIRSHHVECTTRYGLASYTVNTIPADWVWSADEGTTEAAKAKAAAAAQAPGAGGQASAVTESRKVTSARQRTTASHHALVVEATAKGAGLFRGGAGLELTVTAELVYVGQAGGNPVSARPNRVGTGGD